jgi:hypothetical protein
LQLWSETSGPSTRLALAFLAALLRFLAGLARLGLADLAGLHAAFLALARVRGIFCFVELLTNVNVAKKILDLVRLDVKYRTPMWFTRTICALRPVAKTTFLRKFKQHLSVVFKI